MKLYDGMLCLHGGNHNNYRINFVFKEESDLLLVASYPHISRLFNENSKNTLTIKTKSQNKFELLCFELEFIEELIIGSSLFLSLKIKNKYLEQINFINNVFGFSDSNERVHGNVELDTSSGLYMFKTNEKLYTSKMRLIYNILYSKNDVTVPILFFEDSLFNNQRSYFISL